jgi:hypothetical protein
LAGDFGRRDVHQADQIFLIECIALAGAAADANAVHAFVEHKLDLAAKRFLVDFAT